MLTVMDRITSVISQTLAIISATCGALMAVLIIAATVTREVGGTSIPGAMEMIQALLVTMIFLGMARAERMNVHVRATLVIDKFSHKTRGLILRAAHATAAVMVAVFLHAAFQRASQSWGIREVSMGTAAFPMWPVRMIIVIGLFALLLELVRRALTPGAEAVEAPSSAQTI